MLIMSGGSFIYLLITLLATLAGIDTAAVIAIDVGVFMINILVTSALIIGNQNRLWNGFQWKALIDPTPQRVRLARLLLLALLLCIGALYITLKVGGAHQEHESFIVTLAFLAILLFIAILNVLSCGLGVDKVIPNAILSFIENPFSAGYQSLSKRGRHSLRQQHRAEKNIALRKDQKAIKLEKKSKKNELSE